MTCVRRVWSRVGLGAGLRRRDLVEQGLPKADPDPKALAFPADPGVTWFGAIHVHGFDGTALIEQYAAGRWQQVAWPFGDVQPMRLAAGAVGELWARVAPHTIATSRTLDIVN